MLCALTNENGSFCVIKGHIFVSGCVIKYLNNAKFSEYVELIYPSELKIKETTETATSASYLDCYLYSDNGKLATRLYDKRDDFNFPIVNFPFLSSNVPSAPAHGVFVSQLIFYARACTKYQDFVERGILLTIRREYSEKSEINDWFTLTFRTGF